MKFNHIITEEVYEKHQKYLKLEEGGKQLSLEYADLSGLNLSGLDLSGSSILYSNFSGVNLNRTIFCNSNLTSANFTDSFGIGTDFSRTHTTYANFSGSIFSYANFNSSNLHWSKFCGSKLTYVDFNHSVLRLVNFQNAHISDTSVRHASLNNCVGDGVCIRSIHIDPWTITTCHDEMAIGCKQYSIEEWFNFSDEKIMMMDCYALEWWNNNKSIIKNWLNKGESSL